MNIEHICIITLNKYVNMTNLIFLEEKIKEKEDTHSQSRILSLHAKDLQH
jgi:hypothetical protein